MTLDSAEMELNDCFASGQAYVALSRIKSMQGLSLLSKLKKNPFSACANALVFDQNLLAWTGASWSK